MTTLVMVYQLIVASAGYIEGKGFHVDVGPRPLQDTTDLRRTVLVEEVHEVLAVAATVSRVLVSREILDVFGSATYVSHQVTIGRRWYYDVTNPEVSGHVWNDLDYHRRGQREEEVRQRNINLAEWLYHDLLGQSFPGTGELADAGTGVYLVKGVSIGSGHSWVGDRLLWNGPGWYYTDRSDDEEDVTKCIGSDVRKHPGGLEGVPNVYVHWLNAPVGKRSNVLEDANG